MDEHLDSQIDDIRDRVHANDPTAVERARQLADQYPNEPQIWSLLAFALADNDDLDGAILAMTRMIDVAPPDMRPSIFWERGIYECDRDNLEAAFADFTVGIELSKQVQNEYYLESLYFWRAHVLMELDRKAEALADLEHVRDDKFEFMPKKRTKYDILAELEGAPRPWKAMSEPLDSLLEEIELRGFSENPTALERAKILTEQYPDNPKVWEALSLVHGWNGDREAASVAIDQLIRSSPTDAMGYFTRARYVYMRGYLEEALADLNKAIALAIEDQAEEYLLIQTHFWRADVLVALGRKAEARADLEHVPDGVVCHTTKRRTKADILADCEGKQRPWKAMSEPLDSLLMEIEDRAMNDGPMAIERAKTLAEQHPENPIVWEVLADAYAKNGDLEAALAAVDQVIKISPTGAAGHYYRGHFQHRLGNLETALSDLTNAIALGPEDQADKHRFYFRRADVLVALGRKAEARADLEHVPNGYRRYTTRLRTKADILAECEE